MRFRTMSTHYHLEDRSVPVGLRAPGTATLVCMMEVRSVYNE